MASPLIMATLAAGLTGSAVPQAGALEKPAFENLVLAAGNDCTAAVARVVQKTGGQLLSVQPSGDGASCIVTVIVKDKGERPRKVTVREPQ